MAKTRYEIRVRGRLGNALLTAVPDLAASVEAPQTVTVLSGDLTDQGELHQILQTLAGLGVELIEVRRVGAVSAASAQLAALRRRARRAGPTAPPPGGFDAAG